MIKVILKSGIMIEMDKYNAQVFADIRKLARGTGDVLVKGEKKELTELERAKRSAYGKKYYYKHRDLIVAKMRARRERLAEVESVPVQVL